MANGVSAVRGFLYKHITNSSLEGHESAEAIVGALDEENIECSFVKRGIEVSVLANQLRLFPDYHDLTSMTQRTFHR